MKIFLPSGSRRRPLSAALRAFRSILCRGGCDRLPLHISWSICSARAQRLNVVDDPAGAGAAGRAGCGAGRLPLEGGDGCGGDGCGNGVGYGNGYAADPGDGYGLGNGEVISKYCL